MLSSAPAASVGLGATFSPATWDRVPGVSHASLCPWGCQSAGYTGITSAGLAVVVLPMLLISLIARFLLASETFSTNHLDPTQVTKVRGWLTECQSAIWSAKDH